MGVSDTPGVAFKLFNVIARKKINVDNIVQSVGREGTKDISFTVSREDKDEILNILEENPMDLKFNGVDVAVMWQRFRLSAPGMMTHPGVAAKVFEALSDAGIISR